MQLIKDLGTSKTESGRKVRLGVYLCPSCDKEVTVNQYDVNRKRGNKMCYTCSQTANGYKHGLSNSRLYRIWTNMKQRVSNPKNKDYKRYCGLGMTPDWFLDFKRFYDWSMENGYEDGFQIHRKNNDKGYADWNCEWLSQDDHLEKHKNDRPC